MTSFMDDPQYMLSGSTLSIYVFFHAQFSHLSFIDDPFVQQNEYIHIYAYIFLQKVAKFPIFFCLHQFIYLHIIAVFFKKFYNM